MKLRKIIKKKGKSEREEGTVYSGGVRKLAEAVCLSPRSLPVLPFQKRVDRLRQKRTKNYLSQ